MPTFDEPPQPAPQSGSGSTQGTGEIPTEQVSNAEPVTTRQPVASDAWTASAGATPPAVPPPLLPTPAAPPIPPPPAALSGFDPSGVVPPSAEPPKKKSRFGLVGAFAITAAAALGAIVIKFVLPLVLVGAVGQVFDSAFGGPYGRLPGDVRSGFEKRIDAAFGNALDGQTDSQKIAKLTAAVKSGLSRLDDSQVDANFRLTTKALGAVDVASCASVSRAIVAGQEPPEAATNAMINTLSDAELQQWFEIRIAAIEADLRQSPAQVAVTDDQVNPLYQELFRAMSSDDIDIIGQLGNGTTVEDGKLCTAIRDLYSAVLGLPSNEALLFARYDVSP